MRFSAEIPEQSKKHAESPSDAANEGSVNKKDKKKSKKDKKRKKARELLQELKKSNFKKSEIDVALLRIERLRREKSEKSRVHALSHAHS